MAKYLTLVLVLIGVAACSPAKPDSPTFANDVRPILIAHCTRCHGGGGMLNGDPISTSPTYRTPPLDGFFDTYEDQGDCTADGGSIPRPPVCMHGAHSYAVAPLQSLWTSYVPSLMPPPPAAALNDWELSVLNHWIQNPVCGAGPVCAGDGGSVD
jgi:hypothetical protein